MMGNSSSGIIEAASLGCRVINIGQRQQGRECSENVVHCKANKKEILKSINKIRALGKYRNKNIYYKNNTVQRVIDIIEKY